MPISRNRQVHFFLRNAQGAARASGRDREAESRTLSWHVKALVEATPISTPASVAATTWLSRAMVEVGTFTNRENVLLLGAGVSEARPACRRSLPIATRIPPDCPARAAPRDSGIPTRRRVRPRCGRDARTSVSRPDRRDTPSRTPRSRCDSDPEVERQFERNLDASRGEVDIVGEGPADDVRLFVDFLRHEMAVIALVGEKYERSGDLVAGSGAPFNRNRHECRRSYA